jgi:hypothetical protein
MAGRNDFAFMQNNRADRNIIMIECITRLI